MSYISTLELLSSSVGPKEDKRVLLMRKKAKMLCKEIMQLQMPSCLNGNYFMTYHQAKKFRFIRTIKEKKKD